MSTSATPASAMSTSGAAIGAADGDPAGMPISDTTDLRTGEPIDEHLLALLPLVGRWRGVGTGVVAATGLEFRYGQEVTFSHDGRPFLAYDARAWRTDEQGRVIKASMRETGFWRVGAGEDDIEALIVTGSGVSLNFTGLAGDLRWELATQTVSGTPTSVPVDGERRFYALRGDELLYVTELAPGGQPYAAHLNGSLQRI